MAACSRQCARVAWVPARREDSSSSRPRKPRQRFCPSVHAADPKSSIQLIKGFHGVEQNSWRWTMGRFAVTLKPPTGPPSKARPLVLKFSIPDAVLQKTKTMTLTASVQNTTRW